MSIFGNYGDMHAWERVKQIELFHWSILFAVAAGWAIYYGLRHDNDITKGFGVTFLGINLRYQALPPVERSHPPSPSRPERRRPHYDTHDPEPVAVL
jgi:hypothetical protein